MKSNFLLKGQCLLAFFFLSCFVLSCNNEEAPLPPPDSGAVSYPLNTSDSLAMINIYKAIGPWGEEWDFENIQTWDGVQTMLDLDKNELRITGFECYFGRFYNEIPDDFRNLTQLRNLVISGGSLTGCIPKWIGELTHLETLVLGDNYLTGEIPSEIGNLTNLKVLKIINCKVHGSIPESLGNLSNLVFLCLYNNELEGEIPKSLKKLSNIDIMYLNDNHLSGRFPVEILVRPRLTINCNNNDITELPFEVWEEDYMCDPPTLYGNRLTGVVPDSVLKLPRWQKLHKLSVILQQDGYGYSNISN